MSQFLLVDVDVELVLLGVNARPVCARATAHRLREPLVLVEAKVAAVVREQVIARGTRLAQVLERRREELAAKAQPLRIRGDNEQLDCGVRAERPARKVVALQLRFLAHAVHLGAHRLREPRVLLGRPRQAGLELRPARTARCRSPALGEKDRAQNLVPALGKKRPRGLREVVRQLDLARRTLGRLVKLRKPRASQEHRHALKVLRRERAKCQVFSLRHVVLQLRYRSDDGTTCRRQTQGGAMADTPIKRALVSVTDKTGVVAFVKALEDEFGVEVISTGGTARVLEEAGVHVVPIEQYTGFPEMMDGRVKTLHPKVHGGLLARRDNESHMAEAAEHGIGMIDLVVVNLYEFEKTVANPEVTFDDAIEHIDIGGPSMLRSAAKNADSVTVVSDPDDYDEVLDTMRALGGCTTLELRRYLQLKVYETTACYDAAIANWLADRYDEDFPEELEDAEDAPATPDELGVYLEKVDDLRYGENPQQTAAVYRFADDFAELGSSEYPLVGAEQLQGKPLSYNNYLDADAAWNLVREFDGPACVILKHQNPCGSAVADDVTTAYDRAFACDPKSAFGGIIACNREVPFELVEHAFDENGQFVEVIIAPSYTPEAVERMAKRPNLRVLATGGVGGHAEYELRSIDGGVLLQNVDSVSEDPETFTCPTERKPTPEEMDELMFAWRVCKGVKSNAILVSKGKAGIGMGPGQPNRVDSALLACERADEACERMGVEKGGYACASDAFFPFRDNVDVLAEHGVTCIIQPGGSKRDDESIEACNEHGIAMVFTGNRHFRH